MKTIDTTDRHLAAHMPRPNASSRAALEARRARREAEQLAKEQERRSALRRARYEGQDLGPTCVRAGAYDAYNLPSREFNSLKWPAGATAPIVYPGVPAPAGAA